MNLNRPSVKASGRPATDAAGSADMVTIERAGESLRITLEDLARLLGVYPPSVSKYNSILYAAHRGASLIYPEETLETFRAAYAAGLRVLEMDVLSLSDGTQAVMHDDTVDRTTTGTGNCNTFSPATWKQLAIDANTWHGSNFGDALVPPLFSEVLNEFKGRVIFLPEASRSNGAAVVAALQAAGIPTDQAIVQSFYLAQLAPATAAGYPTLFLHDGTGSVTAAKAAGITYAGIDKAATAPQIAAWVASGIKTMVWVINRRWEKAAFLAQGISGFFSDDPQYLEATTPLYVRDTFDKQTWMPGMFQWEDNLTATWRGRFSAPDWWGWDDSGTSFCLQGWACPVKGNANADDYTIDFELMFGPNADATKWGSIYISNNDVGFNDSTPYGATMGYHCLIRKNGTLQIYKRSDVSATSIASQVGTAFSDNVAYKFRLIVSPTTIKLARLNDDGTENYFVSVADATYRGGYFHLGHGLTPCKFRRITIR